METEPSRLLHPIEHRKWAESIADAKAAKKREQLNLQLHGAISVWKSLQNKALNKLKAEADKMDTIESDLYKDIVNEAVQEEAKKIFKSARVKNKKTVAEYRTEVLKSFGY